MIETLTQKCVQGNVNLNMKVGLCGCMQIVTHGLTIEILFLDVVCTCTNVAVQTY